MKEGDRIYSTINTYWYDTKGGYHYIKKFDKFILTDIYKLYYVTKAHVIDMNENEFLTPFHLLEKDFLTEAEMRKLKLNFLE